MKKNRIVLLAAAVWMMPFVSSGLAEEVMSSIPGVPPEKMAEVMRLSQPGENHKKLEPMVGKFRVKSTLWMSPDSPPQTTEGTSQTEWILDGRFIEQRFKGTALGKPFEGRAIMGYDNVKEEFTSVWADSMATGITKSTSEYDEASRTFKEKGVFSCPVEGKDMKFRGVTRIIDNDHYVYEIYHDDTDGREYKSMVIEYERA